MKMTRRRFLQAGAALLPLLGRGQLWAERAAPGFRLDDSGNVFLTPDDPEQWAAFRAALAQWRAETRAQLNYKDDLYRRADFSWSASNYSCCFLMVCDETFWDHRAGRYQVKAFVEHGRREHVLLELSARRRRPLRPRQWSRPSEADSSLPGDQRG